MAALGDISAKISSEETDSLCKTFLKSLISGTPAGNVSDEMEPYLRAVSTCLLEAAKNKATVEALSSSLGEGGVNTSSVHLKTIMDTYKTHRDTMMAHMEATGIAAPSLVDIQWRLDYSVRSKHGGRENVPMYFVTLRVKDRGIVRDIEMIASLEELQDMHARTREAVKAATQSSMHS
jgi:polycomb group RING finger protein 4